MGGEIPRAGRAVMKNLLSIEQLSANKDKETVAKLKERLNDDPFYGVRIEASKALRAIHTDEALGIYGAIDCGAYVGNFLLAAQALGLGTIAQAALARHSGLIRRHFGLDDTRRVVCGISFGFADHEHRINSYRTSRAAIADTVTFVGG
jgi:nitroreductase